MDNASVYTLFQNLDDRTHRIEQYLPTLATRTEMHAAIQAAVAPLATRAEMHAAIQAAIAPLGTREELQAEGEASRQFARVLFEDLRDDNRIILKYLVALSARVDGLARR